MNKLALSNDIGSRIAKIQTLEERKVNDDQLAAVAAYARKIKLKLPEQNKIAKFRIQNQQLAGAALRAIPRQNGKKGGAKGILATMARIGIPLQTAHRWEAMSEIPFEEVEALESRLNEAGEELTSGEIFSMARQGRAARSKPPSVQSPEFPSEKFKTIVIDPPWPINKVILKRRPVEKESVDYATMGLDKIAELPVPTLANEKGCHVYLWFTHKHLPDALKLFEKWGVRYECVITWNKPTAQPLWWRFLTEHCLFGKIGTLRLVKKGEAVSFNAPQQRHSHKPEQFYDLVRKVSPPPRLTMFDYDRAGFIRYGVTH